MPTAQVARGSENRGLGPGGRGRFERGQGGRDTILGLPSLAWPNGGRGTEAGRGMGCHPSTPGSTCLPWSLPVIALLLRVTRGMGQGWGCKALGEVAASCKSLLGQPPYCLDGTIIALEGQEGARIAAGCGTRRRASPSLQRDSACLSLSLSLSQLPPRCGSILP